MRKKIGIGIVLILAVGVALLLNACSAQSKAHWGSNVVVDKMPTDICVVDGKPFVLGINIENEGDVAFIYVNTSGDVVAVHYGQHLLEGTQKQGSISFTGDACPTEVK